MSGSAVDFEQQWKVTHRPRNWIHVCTNGGAGEYEAFPDVCRTADGGLICVFYASNGHVGLPSDSFPTGGRISYCTSADEGRTWSRAACLYDGPDDDRDPSIVQLSDGRLICNFFTLKSDPEGKRAYIGDGSLMVTSSDGGHTWDPVPQMIAKNYYCSAPIRELPDG